MWYPPQKYRYCKSYPLPPEKYKFVCVSYRSPPREANNIDDRHTLNVQMIALILWWLPWSCDDGDLFPTAAISDSCPKCPTGVTPALIVQLHVYASVIATLLNRTSWSHFVSRFFRLFVCNNSPTSRFQYFSLGDSSQSCRIELQRTQYFYSHLSLSGIEPGIPHHYLFRQFL